MRRSKRRTKKRFSRRRQPLPRYDGMIRIKMQANKEVLVGDGNGVAEFRVSWGDTITNGGANALTTLDAPEITRFENLYAQMSVSGCKMQFIPYKFMAGSTDIAAEELIVGSSAIGEAIDATNVRLAVDYDVKSANARLTKYVGVAKSRRRNTGSRTAMELSGSSRWMDTGTERLYHGGKTYFSVQMLGLGMNRAVGMMYVTWYMWYKGQRMVG